MAVFHVITKKTREMAVLTALGCIDLITKLFNVTNEFM